MTTTLLLLLLRILSNPIGNVFQKKLAERQNHPLFVNFFTFLLLAVLSLVAAPWADWTVVSIHSLKYATLAGVFCAVGNSFMLKALRGGDLSVLGPINAYKSVIGVVMGIILLGEMPNVWGLVGMGLIIGGSYFVLDTVEGRCSPALLRNSHIRYRLLAMLLTAIEAVFIKKVILYSSPLVSFFFWSWFGAAFSLLLCLTKVNIRHEMERLKRRHLRAYLAIVLCLGTTQFTAGYIFARMNVGYALALFQLSSIVSIVLGWRIFRERDIRKKLVGAVIMLLGSTILILLN